jgi:two-component system response regulator NreC
VCGGHCAKHLRGKLILKSVTEAHDGRDSIEKALRLRPDLIVLDLSMPVMNGLDAARELKHRMPSVPIILFTFHVDLFVKEAALPCGVSDVVLKIGRRLRAHHQSPQSPLPQRRVIISPSRGTLARPA